MDGKLDHSNSACLALIFSFCTLIQMLMSASITMEVATTTVMTQTQGTHVPAIMATKLTVMDILVRVDEYTNNICNFIKFTFHTLSIFSDSKTSSQFLNLVFNSQFTAFFILNVNFLTLLCSAVWIPIYHHPN